MDSPDALLATLSQSSAVMVAIIGGFLVSRLVALSSEREGLRRQLAEARDRLGHLQVEYEVAHEYRLENSQSLFDDWVTSDLVEAVANKDDVDLGPIVEDNIPRGSSAEEMERYAHELLERIRAGLGAVKSRLRKDDTSDLSLDDLKERGLTFDDRDEDIYWEVASAVAKELPAPRSLYNIMAAQLPLPPVTYAGRNEIEARRLDESIQAESRLEGEVGASEKEITRLEHELRRIASPVGVVPAVWVLGLLSIFGIVLPVVVMATEPKNLSTIAKAVLVGLFVVGLGAVLGYIVWYLKHLNGADNRADHSN